MLQQIAQHMTLAGADTVLPLKHRCAVLTGDLSRRVGAVIGSDVNIEQLLRVVLCADAVNEIAYHALFVARRDKHGDAVQLLRPVRPGLAEQRSDQINRLVGIADEKNDHDGRVKDLDEIHTMLLNGSCPARRQAAANAQTGKSGGSVSRRGEGQKIRLGKRKAPPTADRASGHEPEARWCAGRWRTAPDRRRQQNSLSSRYAARLSARRSGSLRSAADPGSLAGAAASASCRPADISSAASAVSGRFRRLAPRRG